MKKLTELWTIRDLIAWYPKISFPEYQREPNVWSKVAKQRLIDSIVRQFDISSIYLYRADDDSYECIDGRQRLGAIMSFLSLNSADDDDGFGAKPLNEIYDDVESPFGEFQEVTYKQLQREQANGNRDAERILQVIHDYTLTIVELSGARDPEEFNLQFARLNLGTILNSGERLHAMVGGMRDACFEEIGQHVFFEKLGIPTRRYAKEQTASQLVAQIFSLQSDGEFTRTRTIDLQRFFKRYYELSEDHVEWLERIRQVLDVLVSAFDDLGILRNRALSISAVLLSWQEGVSDDRDAAPLAEFMKEFVCRLRWQVGLGLDMNDCYRWLIEFQKHLTQASVEKPAVTARAKKLRAEFAVWRESGEITGDKEYRDREGRDPSDACRQYCGMD